MGPEISSGKKIIKAASACVWRDGHVLLARRGKMLGRGLWSLPGGKQEARESEAETAARELLEETGVVADLRLRVGLYHIDIDDVRYAIACFTGLYLAGEARPASDSDAIAWVSPGQLSAYPLAFNTREAVSAAHKLIKP